MIPQTAAEHSDAEFCICVAQKLGARTYLFCIGLLYRSEVQFNELGDGIAKLLFLLVNFKTGKL